MIRHLLRVIWNRKRANFLIMVEIFCAFLVLEIVAVMAVYYANNYRQPLGFSIDRVWTVTIGRPPGGKDAALAQRDTMIQLLHTVRDLPQVEAACGVFSPPYDMSNMDRTFRVNGREIWEGSNRTTDECAAVFGLTLSRGRWFTSDDDGVAWQPIVVNEQFARDVFGDADPIGRTVPEDPEPRRDRLRAQYGLPPEIPRRVVGVVQEFRQHGEYAVPVSYSFTRYDPTNSAPNETDPPRYIALKVRAGTTAAFEETLARQMQGVARDWSFEVRPVEALREETLRLYTTPLLALSVIAGFLLLMVALGLTGVVWQNVTQRIREIGLRRAKGARIEHIHQQILGELVVMTSFALLVGVAILAQLPFVPLPFALIVQVSPGVYVLSIVLSALAIYLLTVACGWYPARLATRIQPAEALHYE